MTTFKAHLLTIGTLLAVVAVICGFTYLLVNWPLQLLGGVISLVLLGGGVGWYIDIYKIFKGDQ